MGSRNIPLGKYFFILSKDRPDKILEIKGGNTRSNAPITIAKVSLDETNFKDHQLWFHDQNTSTIRSKLNGYCIDVIDDVVQVNEYSTSTSMMWVYSDEKLQMEDDFDLVVSSKDTNLEDGSTCLVRTDEEDAGQRWTFVYCPADFFHIRLADSDLVLDVKGNCMKAGAEIIAFKINVPHTDNQLWFEDMEGIIRSKLNQFVIDTSGIIPMLIPFDRKSENQHWVIIGDRICQSINPNVCLEIKKKSFFLSYDDVIVAKLTADNPLQSFKFDPVPSMTEKRTHTGNGKYFVIRNRHNLRAVELARRGNTNVLRLEQLDRSIFGDRQLFSLEWDTQTLICKFDNQCVNVIDGKIILIDSKATQLHTKWSILGNNICMTAEPHMVLTHRKVNGEDKEDELVVEKNEDRKEQLWDITYQPPMFFYIMNNLSMKVLDVNKDRMEAGVQLILYEMKKTLCENQLWYEDENHILRTKLNGMIIDASSGVPVTQQYNERQKFQHWIFKDNKIQNIHKQDLVLSAVKEFFFRYKIEAQVCNDSAGQLWHRIFID